MSMSSKSVQIEVNNHDSVCMASRSLKCSEGGGQAGSFKELRFFFRSCELLEKKRLRWRDYECKLMVMVMVMTMIDNG